jgi:hypothetical protein
VLCSDTSLKLKLNSFRYYYFLQLSMEVVIEHSFIPMSDSIGPIYIYIYIFIHMNHSEGFKFIYDYHVYLSFCRFGEVIQQGS